MESSDKPRQVNVGEADAGIIDNRHCHGFAALIVVIGRVVGPLAALCTLAKFCVDWGGGLEEDEGSKEAAEGTSLGEAFLLLEGGEGVLWCAVPDGVVMVVEVIKEGDQAFEIVATEQFIARCVSGDGVEHVFDIKKEEGASGGGVVCHVAIDLEQS